MKYPAARMRKTSQMSKNFQLGNFSAISRISRTRLLKSITCSPLPFPGAENRNPRLLVTTGGSLFFAVIKSEGLFRGRRPLNTIKRGRICYLRKIPRLQLSDIVHPGLQQCFAFITYRSEQKRSL